MEDQKAQHAESRIRYVLAKEDRPMRIRELQIKTASRVWGGETFRPTLDRLIREGVIWHENGVVELIDKSGPLPMAPKPPIALPNSADLGIQRPSEPCITLDSCYAGDE